MPPMDHGLDPLAGGEPESTDEAAFRLACSRARVPEETRDALWQLHRTWRTNQSAEERTERLLEDHEHWLLYRRSRDGDPAASRSFERHWRRKIVAFCGRSFAGDELQELTAAFFERVYEHVERRFQWQAPFSAYLGVVLGNLARNTLRSKSRRSKREVLASSVGPEDAGALEPADEMASPERAVLAAESSRRVRAALAELAPADRHVILHCLVECGSSRQLADDLGITVDAVYQRLHRAKKRLRALLVDESGAVREERRP